MMDEPAAAATRSGKRSNSKRCIVRFPRIRLSGAQLADPAIVLSLACLVFASPPSPQASSGDEVTLRGDATHSLRVRSIKRPMYFRPEILAEHARHHSHVRDSRAGRWGTQTRAMCQLAARENHIVQRRRRVSLDASVAFGVGRASHASPPSSGCTRRSSLRPLFRSCAQSILHPSI